MITAAQIRRLYPNAKAPLVEAIIANWHVAEAAGITKQKRIAGFFANYGVETGGITSVSESLNYSVDSLLKKFSRERISTADAKRLGRKDGERALSEDRQRAIANTIYGGAWGKKNLGNTQPNDGWDFRGGGGMQTTGRANYRALGFEDNPQALRDPTTAFLTAVREWDKRGCNAKADRGDIKGTRRAINGGTNGLEECLDNYSRAMSIFPPDRSGVSPLISVDVEDIEEIKPDPEDDVVNAAPPQEGPSDVVLLTNETFEDEEMVKKVQTKLRDLGYSEVGTADGKMGDFTRKAIVLYRGDRGLPYSDRIDTQFVAKLFTDTEKRKQPEGRAEATAAQVRERVPEVRGNWLGKIWARITAAGSFTIAAVGAAWDRLPDSKEYLAPIKDVVGDVPTWAWFVAVAVGAFYLSTFFKKGEEVGVQAFQEGARR